MENRTWILTLAVLLALGAGVFSACTVPIDGAVGEALVANVPDDPSVDIPGQLDPIYTPDGGDCLAVELPENVVDVPRGPDVVVEHRLAVEAPDNVVDVPSDSKIWYDRAAVEARTCGMEFCDEGERCCHPTGVCIPVDCMDCCDALIDPPVENPGLIPDEPGPVD